MHGFPTWLFWPLDLLSWSFEHWVRVLGVAVLLGLLIVWRRRLFGYLAGALWLAFELTRPLHRRLRSWWKNR